MSFDMNKHIIETSLKYDDHNPKHRRQLEEYLTRPKQILKKAPPAKKPFKKIVKAGSPMNIDFSLPPEMTKFLEDK
jgi:hypothetical protein